MIFIIFVVVVLQLKVASSDATNIESSIRREGDEYVINGLKWWTSGEGAVCLSHDCNQVRHLLL